MNALNGLNGRELNIPALTRELLGEPNRRASRGAQWRYGAKGSFAVDVARGLFTDFETGAGGGLLDLVRRVRGGSRADAARWLEAIYHPHNLTLKGHGPSATYGRNRALKSIRAPLARDPAPEAQPDPGGWDQLWRASLPPEGSPVARYLEGRGLSLPAGPGRVLRYHPACPFGADKLPAMLALVRNAETGQPQGVHRTPLTPAGERARGPGGAKQPKMVLGAAGGGALMLSPDWQVETGLAIAEGIESALAGLRRQPWLPTWSAINAGGVRAFPVLAGIEALTIYADNDAKPDGSNPGLEAARSCAARWAAAGRHAEVIWPRAAGADMADLI